MDKKIILQDVRKVLLIQFGDIGDVVWTIPAISGTKQSIKGAQVSVLVKNGFGDLLRNHPAVDDVLETIKTGENIVRRISGNLKLIRALRSRKFDMAVDLRAGDRGSIMAFLSGARIRVSSFFQGVPFWREFLFTHVIRARPLAERSRGASEQTLSLMRVLGIDTDDTIPRIHVDDKAGARAREILREINVNATDWISLNPFSRWQYKEWSAGKWAEVIDWLSSVIVGSPDERHRAQLLLAECEGKAYNLAGQTNLSELAGILHLSRLHLGVDSAAPHIAAAVGTPTITIYGPSNWYDWAPIGEQHRVVLPELDCVPCCKKGCEEKDRSRCLDELSPDKVKAAITEALGHRH